VRKANLMVLGALVAATAVACGGGASPTAVPVSRAPGGTSGAAGAPLLVAINKSADQQYFVDLQGSFVETATSLGANAATQDARLDPSLAVSLVNEAIAAGARGIAITVPDQAIGPAVARAARDAGVVLVATDDAIKDADGSPVPFVGYDGKEMGRQVGEAAAQLLIDEAWLRDSTRKVGVLSVEVQALSVCNDRTDGSKAAIRAAGVPDAQVFSVPYTGETSSARDAAGPVITSNPDITDWVVFGCNDEGVAGALDMLATAGVDPASIIAVGLGAYEACKPWAAGRPTGFRAALFISGLDVGQMAATVLHEAVAEGTALPATSYAPTVMVNRATFKNVMDPVSVESCSK